MVLKPGESVPDVPATEAGDVRAGRGRREAR
jgi:hypothetical protein